MKEQIVINIEKLNGKMVIVVTDGNVPTTEIEAKIKESLEKGITSIQDVLDNGASQTHKKASISSIEAQMIEVLHRALKDVTFQ